jgi:hypothetical protein
LRDLVVGIHRNRPVASLISHLAPGMVRRSIYWLRHVCS